MPTAVTDLLVAPQGEFELARYPAAANETLRAWDAADEYLLRHLGSTVAGTVLIVNDSSGALSTALAICRPQSLSMLSDSYLSHAAIRENLKRNALDPGAVRPLATFDPLPSTIDLVVMKVPKALALLEDQLHRIAPLLHEKTVLVAAGMTRHIHNSTLDLFTKIVGPTRTSLAEKKARLIFCQPDIGRPLQSNPWPKTFTAAGIAVVNHAGVFSAAHLDEGTGLLLGQLTALNGACDVLDLGCGNGVVGTTVAAKDPEARVTFIDESYAAVASTEATFRTNLGPDREVRFLVGNGAFDLAASSLSLRSSMDRVLINPPFHQDHAIGDATAWRMFVESRDVLRKGGELWVVGNRHLAYHAKLQRLFGDCDVVGSNARFVVLRALRR